MSSNNTARRGDNSSDNALTKEEEAVAFIPLSQAQSRERQAARRAAEAAVEELRPQIERLRASLRHALVAARGDGDLIPEPVLLDYLGIESRQTLKNWGLQPDATQGHTRFYEWASVEEVVREG